MDDKERLERLSIAEQLRKIHPSIVAEYSNDKAAHYTGGLKDSGDLLYVPILGMDSNYYEPLSMEYLRKLLKECAEGRPAEREPVLVPPMSAIRAVDGVEYVSIDGNIAFDDDLNNQDITPNCIEFTVLGGRDMGIANAIYDTLPIMFGTCGDTEVEVNAFGGGHKTIRFSRAKEERL